MVKKSKKTEDEPKKSSFSDFLKKRAPIYLGLTALFLVFAVPELTQKNLEEIVLSDLTNEEKNMVSVVMNYNGPNKEGLTILQALDEKIKDEYPNDKIYDDKSTNVSIELIKNDEQNYDVVLLFESYKGQLEYIWNINEDSQIEGKNSLAKNIVDIVDFYD